jgi:hypothetical protein
MKTKYLTSALTVIIISLMFSQQTTQAIYDPEVYYSDDIVPGKEIDWKIKTLDVVGDWYEQATDFYVGDTLLNEGDTLTLKVLSDPDTTSGLWYELLLNNVAVTNSEFWGFGYIWTFYLGHYNFDIPLISPVKFVNETGTYNLYDILWSAYEGEDESYTTDITTTDDLGTLTRVDSLSMGFDLTGDIFTGSIEVHFYYHRLYDDGLEYIDDLDAEVFTKTNKKTGIVEEAYSFISWNYKKFINGTEVTDYTETGHSNFWLKEGSNVLTIPFNWLYGFLGFTTLTVFVIIIRRKR